VRRRYRTYLKRVWNPPGALSRREGFADAERFPFADAIFESLMAAAGLRMIAARAEDGTRVFAAEKG
jgi:hypothetical protein